MYDGVKKTASEIGFYRENHRKITLLLRGGNNIHRKNTSPGTTWKMLGTLVYKALRDDCTSILVYYAPLFSM